MFTLSIQPFSPDPSAHLFIKHVFVNINLPGEMSTWLAAMIMFYGGKTVNLRDEKCEIATHALSVEYDESSRLLESQNLSVRLVTPDWLVDFVAGW